jgi:integrase
MDPQWTPKDTDMATAPLNARLLETLKPPAKGRIELTDGAVSGLKFRLTANGTASWSLQARIAGEKRRFSLGEYPTVGLAKARDKARRLREEAREGHDPIREAREAKQREQLERATRQTVADAIKLYADLHLKPNLRTAAEREAQLRNALAAHAERPIGDLTRLDLQRAIDAKAAEGKLGAANRIRAALVHFAGWCWQRGYLPEHVGAGTTRATRERPRDRVLSLDEVRAIHNATFDLGPLWGPLTRLMVLTAQRRGDVAGARWSEIDLDARRWTLPGERTKNGRTHVVHLSDPVLLELTELQREATSDRVFSTTGGRTPVSGFSKLKLRLDALSGVRNWRLHDLRTAFASALCEAGESESVVDRVLNHAAVGSAPSAVARVYNRAENLPQRAAALDRWASIVIAEGPSDNVVVMRQVCKTQ